MFSASSSLSQTRCACCEKNRTDNHKLQECKACHTVAYCNRECQKIDWKKHKSLCKTHGPRPTAKSRPLEGDEKSIADGMEALGLATENVEPWLLLQDLPSLAGGALREAVDKVARGYKKIRGKCLEDADHFGASNASHGISQAYICDNRWVEAKKNMDKSFDSWASFEGENPAGIDWCADAAIQRNSHKAAMIANRLLIEASIATINNRRAVADAWDAIEHCSVSFAAGISLFKRLQLLVALMVEEQLLWSKLATAELAVPGDMAEKCMDINGTIIGLLTHVQSVLGERHLLTSADDIAQYDTCMEFILTVVKERAVDGLELIQTHGAAIGGHEEQKKKLEKVYTLNSYARTLVDTCRVPDRH